jgi:hypothetical protein
MSKPTKRVRLKGAKSFSKENDKRIEGIQGVAEIAASKNPVVNAVLTTKDVGENAWKVAPNKDPPKIDSL